MSDILGRNPSHSKQADLVRKVVLRDVADAVSAHYKAAGGKLRVAAGYGSFVEFTLADGRHEASVRLNVQQWGDTPTVYIQVGYDGHKTRSKKTGDFDLAGVTRRVVERLEADLERRRHAAVEAEAGENVRRAIRDAGIDLGERVHYAMAGDCTVRLDKAGGATFEVRFAGDDAEKMIAFFRLLADVKPEARRFFRTTDDGENPPTS